MRSKRAGHSRRLGISHSRRAEVVIFLLVRHFETEVEYEFRDEKKRSGECVRVFHGRAEPSIRPGNLLGKHRKYVGVGEEEKAEDKKSVLYVIYRTPGLMELMSAFRSTLLMKTPQSSFGTGPVSPSSWLQYIWRQGKKRGHIQQGMIV